MVTYIWSQKKHKNYSSETTKMKSVCKANLSAMIKQNLIYIFLQYAAILDYCLIQGELRGMEIKDLLIMAC